MKNTSSIKIMQDLQKDCETGVGPELKLARGYEGDY
jgi:hypothetical protein